jgi:MFS family permease
MNNQQTAGVTAAVAVGTQSLEATEQQKRLAISLISGCHTLNHLQYSITSVIFPVIMKELGFGLLQLGMLSAISNFVGQGLQVIYGFFAGFFKRTVVLGVGNVIVGLSAMSQFFVGSYPQLLATRVAIDAGSSPQHPLGASILSRYFPKARGWALTFHHSAGSLGSFIGPALASIALLYMDWRTVFVVFGAASLVMGLTLFMLRDHASAPEETGGKKGNFKANLDAYRLCLKNRNIVFTSLVLMVGAAGRGTGINITYLVPFFMERFGITASGGGLFLTVLQGADRLVFGSLRQACRDHSSYTLSIRNHDGLAGSSNLAGSAFLSESHSLRYSGRSTRLADANDDQRFRQGRINRCRLLDLLLHRLYLRTHLDFDCRLRYGALRFHPSVLCRGVHLYRWDAPADTGKRGRRKKRKGLMRRRRQR